MTPAKENPTPDAIAADWVTRMDRAALTAGEQEALNRWLGADIRHRGAMIRAQVVWQATERAAALRPGALPAPVLPAPVPPVAASASPP
ncbi:FecR/PupR family sigma factor regulator, partial [Gluconacetobacter sacchari]